MSQFGESSGYWHAVLMEEILNVYQISKYFLEWNCNFFEDSIPP